MQTFDTVVFGGGCFWCTEAVFKGVIGVIDVEPGYAGGQTENPAYETVCSGTTGHAEVCRILFDPAIISYHKLLMIFFAFHDPTTLNRQGADTGTQYRSLILTLNSHQQNIALSAIDSLNRDQVFGAKIVTEVKSLETFYPAEDYHRDYYTKNASAGYCRVVISPKVAKIRKSFTTDFRK